MTTALTTEERDELRATARGVLTRSVGEAPVSWEQIVELGWTSIHLPERHGGAGCGFAELAVVLHEMGRALTPSPFLASAVLASGALLLAGDEALSAPLLDGLAAGERLGSVALASPRGSYDLHRLAVTWRSQGGDLRLDGAAGFVPDADLADHLIVAARSADCTAARGDDPAALVVDPRLSGVTIRPTPTIDTTRRLFSVTFDDVAVEPTAMLCEPGPDAADLLGRVLALGVIATACDATGVAAQVLETSAGYARVRTQFGKPIGSFQAVKHHCANMAIAVEASRAATSGAAEILDGDRALWADAAAITSSYVGPACSRVCGLGMVVHGGIGFTWEHDSHRYLERAKLDEVLFGTPSWHRRRLADSLLLANSGS